MRKTVALIASIIAIFLASMICALVVNPDGMSDTIDAVIGLSAYIGLLLLTIAIMIIAVAGMAACGLMAGTHLAYMVHESETIGNGAKNTIMFIFWTTISVVPPLVTWMITSAILSQTGIEFPMAEDTSMTILGAELAFGILLFLICAIANFGYSLEEPHTKIGKIYIHTFLAPHARKEEDKAQELSTRMHPQ